MHLIPSNKTPAQVQTLIERALPASRFTVEFAIEPHTRGRTRLVIYQVRLKRAKDYCGNHAGPCKITGFNKPHRPYKYLEGADWVAFDDMLNDICDRYSIEATIKVSGEFVGLLRRGRERRTFYPDQELERLGRWFTVWDGADYRAGWDDSHFGVRRDAPRSYYPVGTPGVPEWRTHRAKKQEDLLIAAMLEERRERRRQQRRERAEQHKEGYHHENGFWTAHSEGP